MLSVDLLLIMYVWGLFQQQGSAVIYNSTNNFYGERDFKCNSTVDLVCQTEVKTTAVDWKIANNVSSQSIFAAQCYKTTCIVNPTYSHNYKFTYDEDTGISNVTIKRVTLQHDQLEFSCDQTSSPFRTLVIVPPEKLASNITENATHVTIALDTDCIYPDYNFSFSWKVKNEQQELTNHPFYAASPTREIENCTENTDCTGDRSSRVRSILTLPKLNDGINKYFVVEVKYRENVILSLNIDRPIKIKVDGAPPVCDEKLCLTCWILIVILLSITAATIFIVLFANVCRMTVNQRQWKHWKTSIAIGAITVFSAHAVATLLARFCRHADVCNDEKCLPCWAYCVILLVVISTSVFIIVFTKVCYGEKMIGRLRIWEVLAISVIFLAAIAYVAIILLARFCKVKEFSLGTDDINCDIYGIILASVFIVQVFVVLAIKGCCRKKGVVQAWEVIFIIGFIILIVVEVVFAILSGYRRKYTDKINLAVSCWSIFLIVFGATFVFFVLVTLIYIFLEPLQEVKIVSLKVGGNLMQAQIQWKCRLVQHKQFFVQLDLNSQKKDASEISYEVVDKESGLLQGVIAGLTLDSQYRAHVYTKMHSISSLEKTVEFDTKGRPMVPTDIREDEALKTESSVTLTWKTTTKATDEQYLIKYKRQKVVKAKWILTKEINKTKFTLDNLKPGTSYTIIVIAKNQIGLSEESKPIVVKTRAKIPEPPTDFHCTSVSQEEVTVSWKPSLKISKQKFCLSVNNLTNYEERSACSEDEIWITYDGSKTMEYTVKELEPGTEYVFEIVTVVGKRASKRSALLFITTEGSRNEPHSYQLVSRDKKQTSVFHLTSKQT